jgi:hypothetical protein
MTRPLVTFRVGWLLVGLGVAAGAVAAFVLATAVGPSLKDTFLRDPCTTPCSESRDLDAGNYLVFERVGSSRTIGPLSTKTEGPATVTPDDVSITSSTGQELEVGEPGTSQTIDRNGTTYGGVVSFHVPADGRYQVSIDAPDPTRVLVAPSLGQTFVGALPGLAAAAVASIVGVIGLVVLIIAWLRRRTPARPA